MAQQNRDNSGILFKNDRKEKNTHPDFRGSAVIGGCEMWVSGWTKQGQKGPFITLAFQVKEQKGSQASKPDSADLFNNQAAEAQESPDLPF